MEFKIEKVSFVGFGNVGSHLAFELDRQNIAVTHIYTRNQTNVKSLATEINAELVEKIADLPDDQLVIVCVPDSAIAAVIDHIPENCPVAYTSGSTELNSFSTKKRLGVFYPLQTFTKGVPLNIFEVPFFIEANDDEFGRSLFDLAWLLSRKVHYASSQERKHLHLAAVWVNNFTNHMSFIANEFLNSKDLDFELLKPLLSETVKKLQTESPKEAQTGPARRGDDSTISAHLKELSGHHEELYRLITDSIKKTYSND